MSSREKGIAGAAQKLDGLLDELDAAVAALSAILTRPALPPDDESTERLVSP